MQLNKDFVHFINSFNVVSNLKRSETTSNAETNNYIRASFTSPYFTSHCERNTVFRQKNEKLPLHHLAKQHVITKVLFTSNCETLRFFEATKLLLHHLTKQHVMSKQLKLLLHHLAKQHILS